MAKIRVLIVDDSVVIRRLLTDELAADPALEVVGTASNGRLALARITQLNPDVVILDIEMPEMDGLAALAEIRKTHRRLPVIMFSSLTERGAEATLDALALGASDYFTKPANAGSLEGSLEVVRDQLIPKIKALCSSTFGQSEAQNKGHAAIASSLTPVAAGASPPGGRRFRRAPSKSSPLARLPAARMPWLRFFASCLLIFLCQLYSYSTCRRYSRGSWPNGSRLNSRSGFRKVQLADR